MKKYLVQMSNRQEFVVDFESKYGIDFITYLKNSDSRLTPVHEESLGFIYINAAQIIFVKEVKQP